MMRAYAVLLSAAIALGVHAQLPFHRFVGGWTVKGSSVAPNGNILLCGHLGGWLASHGMVVCLDPDGNTLWSLMVEGMGPGTSTIGWLDYPEITFSDIAWTGDRIAVAGGRGAFEQTGNYYSVFPSLVLDTMGNVLEAKSVPVVHPHAATHVRPYGANEVLRGYYAYGNFGTSFLLSRGPAYPIANTYDSRSWSFPVGMALYQECSLYDMVVLPNGNCAALGGQSYAGPSVLAMHDSTLAEVWNVTFTATGLNKPTGRIAATPGGGVVVAMAETEIRVGNEPVHLSRYSAAGALDWSRVLEWPTDARLADVHVRDNGKIMVAGGLWVDGPADSSHLWLMQVDTLGNVDWIQRYGNLGVVDPLGLHVTPAGDGYVMTTRNGHVLRVDTLGQLGSCHVPGAVPFNTPVVPGAAPVSNVYLFGSGPGWDWLWYPVAHTIWDSAAACAQPLGWSTPDELPTWSVGPNPLTARAALVCSRPIASSIRIALVDLHGRTVRTLHGNGSCEVPIERGALASGVYTVLATNDNGPVYSTRVVVE